MALSGMSLSLNIAGVMPPNISDSTMGGNRVYSPRFNRQDLPTMAGDGNAVSSVTSGFIGASTRLRVMHERLEQCTLTSSISKASPCQIVAYLSELDSFLVENTADDSTKSTACPISTKPLFLKLSDWLQFISNSSRKRYLNSDKTFFNIRESEARAVWGVFASMVHLDQKYRHKNAARNQNRNDKDLHDIFRFDSDCSTDISEMSEMRIDIRYLSLLLMLQGARTTATRGPSAQSAPKSSAVAEQGPPTTNDPPVSLANSLTLAPSSFPSGNNTCSSSRIRLGRSQSMSGGVAPINTITSPALHPSAACSPLLSPRASPPARGSPVLMASSYGPILIKNATHAAHITFLRQNIKIILQLLTRSYTLSSAAAGIVVYPEHITILQLILEFNPSPHEAFPAFLGYLSAPSARSDSVEIKKPEWSLQTVIAGIEMELSECESENHELSQQWQSFRRRTALSNLTKQTVIVNEASSGKTSVRQRSLSVTDFGAQCDGNVEDGWDEPSVLSVTDSADSTVYVPMRMALVKIANCKDCRIVALAVEGSVTLSNCSRVTLHAAGRAFTVENCYEAELLIASKSPPVLIGDVRSTTLGPLSVISKDCIKPLRQCGLSPCPKTLGMWTNPIVLPLSSRASTPTPAGLGLGQSGGSPLSLAGSQHQREEALTIMYLRPDALTPLVIPASEACTTDGEEDENRQNDVSLTLPAVYADALQEKQALANEVLSKIVAIGQSLSSLEASKSEGDSTALSLVNGILLKNFTQWLGKSRRMRELIEIVKFENIQNGSVEGASSVTSFLGELAPLSARRGRPSSVTL